MAGFREYQQEREQKRQPVAEPVQQGGFAEYRAAREASRPQKPKPTWGSRVHDFATGTAHGKGFGFLDEAEGSAAVRENALGSAGPIVNKIIENTPGLQYSAGAVDATIGLLIENQADQGSPVRETYETARDASRDEIDTARDRNPLSTFAGEIVGTSYVPATATAGRVSLMGKTVQGAGIGTGTDAMM
ncbi:MAG: hypothetical protein AAGK02_07095, partial [Pseudomonadota bacterium]